ncbi:hypothetical protein C8A03DRAFT_33144 [Achaetomium macrosporum]|uniref:Uncharacterized protein n=1 Tax=Achaetomium macrosporum TaxID=79813 RepID=A0AAN7CB56_9PEZI|nr:hypothetical protein C8A03DRAFT_33144 [Achaetomium macrosporum]
MSSGSKSGDGKSKSCGGELGGGKSGGGNSGGGGSSGGSPHVGRGGSGGFYQYPCKYLTIMVDPVYCTRWVYCNGHACAMCLADGFE